MMILQLLLHDTSMTTVVLNRTTVRAGGRKGTVLRKLSPHIFLSLLAQELCAEWRNVN